MFFDFTKSSFRIFLLLIAAAVVFRLPSLFIPYMDIDEVMWGLLANAIVDGGTPYITVMGEKPPLVYLVYAGIFTLFGKHNYFAIHVLGILWMSVTGFFIFKLVRKVYHESAAILAAITYIVFGSATGFRMLATTGELLMNLPLVLSTLAFFVATQKGSLRLYFFSGFLAVCAALFRQQSGIHMGAYVGFLLVIALKEQPLKNFVKPTLAIFMGSVIVLCLLYMYLLAYNAWDAFWFWNFSHNASYIKSGFLNHAVMKNFALRTGHVLLTTLPLWILACLRLKKILSEKLVFPLETTKKLEVLVAFYFLFSLIATIPGGRFFPHYFLQAFPALCILASLEFFERGIAWRRFVYVYMFLILAKLPFVPAEMAADSSGDYALTHKTVGEYIKKNSAPDDKIFIWGWSQGIYLYAERGPATRFISTDFLTGRSPSQNNQLATDTSRNVTPKSWQMLFDDFDRQKPLYILDTSVGNYHDYGIYPMQKFPQILQFVSTHYRFEKSIDGIDLYRLKSL